MDRDEEGYIIVTVKDLIEFLSDFPPELSVGLDKDGWAENEIEFSSIKELIKKRGVFQRYKSGKDDFLMINN
jgi:hypothetical protein